MKLWAVVVNRGIPPWVVAGHFKETLASPNKKYTSVPNNQTTHNFHCRNSRWRILLPLISSFKWCVIIFGATNIYSHNNLTLPVIMQCHYGHTSHKVPEYFPMPGPQKLFGAESA